MFLNRLSATQKQSGFTLVELSLVVLVISIIISGVIVAARLADTAKLSTVQKDLEEIQDAITAFERRHGGIPGDMWDAVSRLGCTGCNGNGDGKLTGTEPILFWQHLSLANVIEGNYDGTTLVPGQGIKASKFASNAGYSFTSDAQKRLRVTLSTYNGVALGDAALTPKQAWNLDKMMDDGSPNSGFVLAYDGGNASGACTDTGEYEISNDGIACTVDVIVQGKQVSVAEADQATATECPDGTAAGGTRTVSCPIGTTGPDLTETCRTGGVWEITSGGPCVPDSVICAAPATYPNATVDDTSAGATEGEVRNITCDAGFTGTSTNITCTGGEWQGSGPVCASAGCGTTPGNPTNGSESGCSGTGVGDSCNYSCNTGYTQTGSASRTCQSDTTWDGTPTTCTIVTCSPAPPTAPTDGSVSCPSGHDYGDSCTYSCDTGHTMTGGASTTCQSDASWDNGNTPPTCTIIDCGAPGDPTDGSSSCPSGTTYGETCTFTCDTGYDLSGSASRTCQSDTTWDGTATTCTLVDCGALSAPSNGSINCPSGTTYNESCSYSCDTGYTLNGNASRTCQADSNWTGSDPSCDIQSCAAPPPVGWSYTVVDAGGTNVGDKRTTRCDSSSWYWGMPVEITCHTDQTWINGPPICFQLDCSGCTTVPIECTDTIVNCSAITCSAPPSYYGATVSGSGTGYADKRDYTCDTSGTDGILMCDDDGKWAGILPICEGGLPVTDDLVVWLDASNMSSITDTGGATDTWADISVANACSGSCEATSSGSSRPMTGGRTLNGLNVIEFDGSNDWMDLPAFDSALSQPNTIILAVKRDDTIGGRYLIDGTAAGRHAQYVGSSKNLLIRSDSTQSPDSNTVTTNPMVLSTVFDNPNSAIYVDGLLLADNDTLSPGDDTLPGITLGNAYWHEASNKVLDGYIAEILVYDAALSNNDREEVECYLGEKWGIDVNNGTCGITAISGMLLWLDAADESTITDSSGTVTQWDDKSGNGYHVIQASPSNRPTTGVMTENGLNVIDFDTGEYLYYDLNSVVDAPITAFMVHGFDGSMPAAKQITSGRNHLGNKLQLQTKSGGVVRMKSGPGTLNSSYTATNNNTAIYTAVWDDNPDSNNGSSIYVNGIVEGSNGNTGPEGFDGITINSDNDGSSSVDAYFGEVIYYEGILSAADRESVECYLGDKWNITVGHCP